LGSACMKKNLVQLKMASQYRTQELINFKVRTAPIKEHDAPNAIISASGETSLNNATKAHGTFSNRADQHNAINAGTPNSPTTWGLRKAGLNSGKIIPSPRTHTPPPQLTVHGDMEKPQPRSAGLLYQLTTEGLFTLVFWAPTRPFRHRKLQGLGPLAQNTRHRKIETQTGKAETICG